jgi:hypothetical protein
MRTCTRVRLSAADLATTKSIEALAKRGVFGERHVDTHKIALRRIATQIAKKVLIADLLRRRLFQHEQSPTNTWIAAEPRLPAAAVIVEWIWRI